MSNYEKDINVSYIIEEIENSNQSTLNIEELMAEIENNDLTSEEDDSNITHMLNYQDNFTVKELLLICDYYGFSKKLKNNKCNKDQIIQHLVYFESDPDNSEIVCKRRNMWFYIEELKNDKFMKKYILL